jgi:hypothetical protein
MMHYNQVVVTLVDNNKKPLREYNVSTSLNGRQCDVFANADTEYKFLIKNNLDKRIIVSIDIDGSCVTGNGLILGAFESDYIERFLEVNKKFKTSLTSGKDVADPSNKENGNIKVTIHKEAASTHGYTMSDVSSQLWNQPLRGRVNLDYNYDNNVKIMSATCVNYSCDTIGMSKSLNHNEKLATVEGGISNQNFSRTEWNGNDLYFGELSFGFTLKLSEYIDPDWNEYLRLKNKFKQ